MEIIDPHRFSTSAQAFDGFGNASRSFDGVSDNVDSIGTTSSFNFIHISKVFSITLWAKWDEYNTNNAGALVANNYAGNSRGFLLQLDNRSGIQSNGIRFIIYNSNTGQLEDLKIDSCVPDSGWHHWALRSDGSTVSAYRDGTFIGSYNYQYTSTGNAGNELGLGFLTNPTTPLNHINGNLADVRIYDTELTATDISDIYSGTNITTNLFGHWLTDADNVLDAAGTNHGTNYGSKYSYDNPSPPVEFGSASRLFDGVSDYVDLGNIHNDTVFTVSAWIKRDRIDGTYSEGVVGKWATTNDDDKHWLLYSTQVSHSFIINQTNNTKIICAGPASISSNQWYHLAATLDGTNIKLYVDGSLVDTQTYDGTIKINATNTKIGVFSDSNNNFFEGKIADVRYYDTDLTASQISDIYSGTGVQTNLVGHWLTDNDDVEDKAGSNDGTNFGSVYSYDNPPMDLVPSRQASRSFDGVDDYIDLGDSDDFSFGDGSNDSPFSISAWIKPNAGSFRILTKYNNDTNTREYTFTTDSSNRLIALLYDQSNSNTIVRRCSSNLMSNYFGQWVHVVMTYDGSSTHAGLKCFINKVREDDLSTGSGSYVSMENTNESAKIGVNGSTAYSNGKKADVRLYNSELSTTDILNIYNGTTDRTNLIGQWLTNSDDVLDHAGTNDGTNFGSTYSTDSPS